MNKRTFMSKMKKELRALPDAEINEILKDFDEHFSIGQTQGKTQAAIAQELGSPEFLAQNYLENKGDMIISPSSGGEAAPTKKDVSQARLFVVLFNALLTWWLALIALYLLYRFWKTSVYLAIGSVTAFSTISSSASDWHSVLLLLGISLCAFAIGSGIINYFVTKWSVIGAMRYIQWNKKIYNEGF